LELYFGSKRSGGYGRTDIWVSRRATKNDPWELYNLVEDRTESNNLASDFPEKVMEMEARWDSMLEEMRSVTPRVD